MDPLLIETDRLVIRAIDEDDLPTFHEIAGRREVALMLASVPHPLSLDAAREWIAGRVYQAQPGFSAGIYRRNARRLYRTSQTTDHRQLFPRPRPLGPGLCHGGIDRLPRLVR